MSDEMPDEIYADWMPVDVGCGEWDKVPLGDGAHYTRTAFTKRSKPSGMNCWSL